MFKILRGWGGGIKIKAEAELYEERFPKLSWIQSPPNTNDMFTVHRKINLKIHMKSQKNSKTNKKKEAVLPSFRIY